MSYEEFKAKRTARTVTPERARQAASRLIDAAFHNRDKERPRFTIPVEIDDDDVVIMDFIEQCELSSSEPTGGKGNHE